MSDWDGAGLFKYTLFFSIGNQNLTSNNQCSPKLNS